MKKMLTLLVVLSIAGASYGLTDDAACIGLWHFDSSYQVVTETGPGTYTTDTYIPDDDSVQTWRNNENWVDRFGTYATSGNPITLAAGDYDGGPGNHMVIPDSGIGSAEYPIFALNVFDINNPLKINDITFEGWIKYDVAENANRYLFTIYDNLNVTLKGTTLTMWVHDNVVSSQIITAPMYDNSDLWQGIKATYNNGVMTLVTDAGTVSGTGIYVPKAGKPWYYLCNNKGKGWTSYVGALDEWKVSVPEPATLALLGIGGLLLRRKRRLS